MGPRSASPGRDASDLLCLEVHVAWMLKDGCTGTMFPCCNGTGTRQAPQHAAAETRSRWIILGASTISS